MVIRLNNKAYDEKKFISNGISHTEIFFEDGSTPKKVNFKIKKIILRNKLINSLVL